jgi:nucleoside-diphosphate-sugar epimerase
VSAHPSIAQRPLPTEDLELILDLTRDCWSDARRQSFFITGGTGFIGRWLLESFAHANDRLGLGASITVLSRDPAAFARNAPHLAARRDFHWLAGDVRSFDFPAGQFPLLIHAATSTQVPVDAQGHGELLDEIVSGTRRVLDFAKQAGAKRLLFTSSGAVYGPQPAELSHLPESYPGGPDAARPESSYGVGKRTAEELCRSHAAAHGYAVTIARCFAFVGPLLPMDGRYAIGNFIRDALKGTSIEITGDGTAVRSYLYAADLAAWLWTILFRGQPAMAYNAGSMQALSMAELAETVRGVLKSGATVRIARPPVPGVAPSRYVPSVELAERDLGLRGTIPLAEAIKRTARWCQPDAASASPG